MLPPGSSVRLLALQIAMTAALLACEKRAAPRPMPPTVFVTTVGRRDVPLTIEAVSTLDGYDNADIRARVRGYLQTQNYKDGSAVKVGQLLFTIEPTEYVAAVASAKASLQRAQVAKDRNRVQLERYQGLFKTGMISQQDLDNVSASVADAEGQVTGASAQLQQAQLNLSYTQIHSPLDGVAGLALVRVGNLVGQDSPTLLTTVSQIDPIRVNFSLSEVDYVKYPERFKHIEPRDLAWVKKQLSALDSNGRTEGGDPGIELILADGSVFSHRAIIASYNRQIDPGTGTIQVQALASNPDGNLRPGQYARVRIRREDAGHDVIVIPDKALISVQGQYSVAVVGPDNKAQLRRVELGPSAHGTQIIDKGLVEGDRVVVDGVQKVSDGALVDPRPAPDGARTTATTGVVPAPTGAAKN